MKPALFSSFKGYKLNDLCRDVMSGLLVAIIALPLSIALGIQSGGTLQQGIITAIVAGFCISAFGGCRVQIGGPTAAFVTIIVGYIGTIGFLGLYMATILAGIIMILLGVFKIGGLVKYIPYPIVVGFTSGIGVTLLFGQLADFTGIQMTAGLNIFGNSPEFLHSEFINKVANLSMNISSLNLMTLAIGMLTVAIMVILPAINKKIPAAFVALVVATLVNCLIGYLDTANVANVATIGSLYPNIKAEFVFPEWNAIPELDFTKLIMPAIVIAFLGSIESLLSATVADNLIGKKHDSNAELVGQGIANIASACCGGLPATGAIARTAANVQNGGKSPIAGITHSLVLLLMFFVLMPVVKFVPMASLAAVLIMVSINMANFKLFAKMTTFNKKDLAILLVTFCLTVYKDLVYGVIGGIAITFILMATDVFKKNVIEVNDLDTEKLVDGTKTKVIIPQSNLTFINYQKLLNLCEQEIENYSQIIVDMSNIKRCDVSSMEKFVKVERRLIKSGKTVNVINANDFVTHHLNKMRAI